MGLISSLNCRFGALASLLAVAGAACAVGARPVTDLELAKSPVIVIGYWPKASWTSHTLTKDGKVEAFETRTRLVITKVVSGDGKLGDNPLLCANGADWS